MLDEQPLIIDVRQPDEFAHGHIPGAINVPLTDIVELTLEDEAILVCQTGRQSFAAKLILDDKGFRTKRMVNGMLQWEGPLE
ncbi:hypothetical protein A4S06_09075 [Erysipelotrichaceae bacterium MTC7]|nr:hypothetical protein A4S06_09075 [Erysipelotrichaceae bacterium MTC7]